MDEWRGGGLLFSGVQLVEVGLRTMFVCGG
jgi:hypothetical protein